ncbi:MAG: hypothetical protein L6422_05655 [Candidatus Marinimicrobia bacterium]|nr:hypothetical protein [Candidatus Neomarinimicrobiota bacterium]
MKLTDKKIIEFLSKSPIKNFECIRDTFKYLDGQWTWEELEYELFDDALGDNLEKKVKVKVPKIKGIPAYALLSLTWLAKSKSFHLVRRRTKKEPNSILTPNELIVFYELTHAGREVLSLLDAICIAKEKMYL